MLKLTIQFFTLIALASFGSASDFYDDECPLIISKLQWGGRKSRSGISMTDMPMVRVFIHNCGDEMPTSQSECKSILRATQAEHMNVKNYNDIAHNFMVGPSGQIYEGRGWKKCGPASFMYVRRSIHICCIGNYDRRRPTEAMTNAIRKLIRCGIKLGYLAANTECVAHRDIACTTCPGDALYEDMREKWLRFSPGQDLNSEPC